MIKKIWLAGLIVLLVIGVVFFVRINQSPYSSSVGGNSAGSESINPGNVNGTYTGTGNNNPSYRGDEDDEEYDEDDYPGNYVTNNSPSSANNSSGSVNKSGITATELAKHSSQSDCWIVYSNKVYDITSFLPRHPGGVNAIARYCGTQGFESAFLGQHGTSKVSMLMKVGVFIGDFDVMGNFNG